MTHLSLTKRGDEKTPNLSNKRTIKTVLAAIVWAEENLHEDTPLPVASKIINDVLGQTQTVTGSFLRRHLLITHGGYRIATATVKGFCQHYLLNGEGLAYLKGLLNVPTDTISKIDKWRIKYADDLKTLDFKYTEKSYRLWHGAQHIDRASKQEFWAPYLPYDYDINACAPNLLIQTARMVGPIDEELIKGVQAYLDDKAPFRQRVAELAGVDLKDAKGIINSLFNGAKLTVNRRHSAFKTMKYDVEAMRRVQADAEIEALQAAIRKIWQHIDPGHKIERRWVDVYQAAEREVLDVITGHLAETNNKCFTEHDGWRCQREVDLELLQALIKDKTGYELSFSRNHP